MPSPRLCRDGHAGGRVRGGDEEIVGQIPVGRLGEADEVARCVTFLAADEAGWITGSTLTINGGQFMD